MNRHFEFYKKHNKVDMKELFKNVSVCMLNKFKSGENEIDILIDKVADLISKQIIFTVDGRCVANIKLVKNGGRSKTGTFGGKRGRLIK